MESGDTQHILREAPSSESSYGAVISAIIVLAVLIAGFAWVASQEFAKKRASQNDSAPRTSTFSAPEQTPLESFFYTFIRQ